MRATKWWKRVLSASLPALTRRVGRWRPLGTSSTHFATLRCIATRLIFNGAKVLGSVAHGQPFVQGIGDPDLFAEFQGVRLVVRTSILAGGHCCRLADAWQTPLQLQSFFKLLGFPCALKRCSPHRQQCTRRGAAQVSGRPHERLISWG